MGSDGTVLLESAGKIQSLLLKIMPFGGVIQFGVITQKLPFKSPAVRASRMALKLHLLGHALTMLVA